MPSQKSAAKASNFLLPKLFLIFISLLFSNFSIAATSHIINNNETDNESLALMDDQQVREILVNLVKQQQQELQQESIETIDNSNQFVIKKDELITSLQNFDNQLLTIWDQITKDQSFTGFILLLFWLLVSLSIAHFIKQLAHKSITQLLHQPPTDINENALLLFAKRSLSHVVSVVAFFIAGTLIIFASTFVGSDFSQSLLAIFKLFTLVLLINTLAKETLSFCKLEVTQYKPWIITYAVLYAFSVFILPVIVIMGLEKPIETIITIISGLCVNLLVNCFVWSKRREITLFFTTKNKTNKPSWGNFIWFSAISAWLLSLWWFWANATFMEDTSSQNYVTISWWITILFPIIDRLFNVFLTKAVKHPWLYSSQFENRANQFKATLQNGFRLLLLAFAVFLMADSWGYSASSLIQVGWVKWLLVSILNVVLINLCAYIAWTFIQSAIERRLPDVEEDDDESPEGEGGGDGATRSETLLPLLRSFILSFIVVTAVLSSLSAMGVEIAPLLAGAGVLGIAIGFGAQKLVADVISGIFFLLDDAFRKGEYIEAANMRGTVEQISIRSMRLRHHLGAVQTVPYSEVSTVKNLSRDWITMKLEFRLPYNTDSEKVRKVIKKVGISMLEDPEMGPNFILPLKSQGVMRVEESALIFRMKFTSKPGEQWVIRREAYRRVIDALESKGIQFAHRAVHVLLPDQSISKETSMNKENSDNTALKTAAASSILDNPSHKIDEPGGE